MKFILCSVGTGQICILRNISGFFMQAKMGCKRLKMEVFGQPEGGAPYGVTWEEYEEMEQCTDDGIDIDLPF